jgi:glucosamine--fructose-6-phosphate aminotransferase (isomerizing)
LRNELCLEGVACRSETDTEVIPQLLGRELRNGADCLEDAVRAICPRLRGSYAFAALCVDDANKIVGVRHGNPLVVGFGAEGFCLSSDALAFGSCADRMASLCDGELAVLTLDGVRFVDSEGRAVRKEVVDVDCSWADTELNGHPHYMLEVALDVLRARQVVITACGTSRHASLVGRYLFSKVAGKFCDVVMASEFGYFADSVDKHTLVIAVSQSGETADVLEGVRLAKEAGARIVSVVNRPSCQLADESDHVIRLNCGAEIGVAATKSLVCQLAVFYLFAFAMANRLDEGRADLEAASEQLSELLRMTNHSLETLAFGLKDSEHFYYIGRGTNFATAMEGALKMKEVSYIHAEGMPAGELKHGTLALIEKGSPVLAVCPDDDTYQDTIGNVMEAKTRGGHIIGVSDRESGMFDDWVRIPTVPPLLYPLMSVVPLQLLAYHMAVIRSCDPDKPRTLAKSVTVK